VGVSQRGNRPVSRSNHGRCEEERTATSRTGEKRHGRGDPRALAVGSTEEVSYMGAARTHRLRLITTRGEIEDDAWQ
jgi:hypothetical protein